MKRLLSIIGVCVAAAGCEAPSRRISGAGLGPERVKIDSLTEIASFDDDDQPDGFRVWLQALDGFGEPVKLAGDVVFELYTFQPASGQSKGERLVEWHRPVHTRRDQETFWNRASQMYHFELVWSPPNPAPDKFVLAATVTTAEDDHLSDEYELEVNVEVLKDQVLGQ